MLISIFFSSVLAISKVMFVIGAGSLMAHLNILNSTMSSQLGTLVFTICVPCMLFVQIGDSLTLETLEQMSVVVGYAFINLFFNIISGLICIWFFENVQFVFDFIVAKRKKPVSNRSRKDKDPSAAVVLNPSKSSSSSPPPSSSPESTTEFSTPTNDEVERIEVTDHQTEDSESTITMEEDTKSEHHPQSTTTQTKVGDDDHDFEEKEFSNFAPMIEENEPMKQQEEFTQTQQRDRAAVRRTLLLACSFGNAASMALGLIGGLYTAEQADELKLAISYVSVYMSISQSLMYSLGYVFLAGGAQQTELRELDENGNPIVNPPMPIGRKIIMKVKKLLPLFLTPPSVAVILASIVALIPVLKMIFFDTEDKLFPHYPAISPPLGFITSAMEMIGNAAIPCITMVLGANLVNGTKSKDVHKMDIVTVTFSKLIIGPIFGIISTYIGHYFGLISNDVMWLVLLLETATPPAQSLIVLFGRAGKGEKELSTVLFYTYLFSVVFMTIFLCIFYVMIQGSLAD